MRTPVATEPSLVVSLDRATPVDQVGGKAFNLGTLRRLGVAVPDGFVLTDAALRMFLESAGLVTRISSLCERLETRSATGVRDVAAEIDALLHEQALPPRLAQAVDAEYRRLAGSPVIVRSSAVGEDSGAASFAGQLDSIAGISSTAGLHQALVDVWASRWSERALAYQIARHASLDGMGVVVQRQIDARMSGVLFTRAPYDARVMLVEYCGGLGEALVSGRENPGRFSIARDGFRWTKLADPERPIEGEGALFDERCLVPLAQTALLIEQAFGGPQDIEWTMDHSGAVWIVQARPITVQRSVGTVRLQPDQEPRTANSAQRTATEPRPATEQRAANSEQRLWSNANVNENFPQPICPLLYSVARAGYYHYFRNLGRAFGVSPRRLAAMEQPLRHIIGVHGARMYYNLTSIHTVLRAAPFGDLLADAFNDFVGADEVSPRGEQASFGAERSIVSRMRQAAELARIAARTTWQYAFLTRRVERFERTVDAFAARTHPDRLPDRTLPDLVDDFRGFVDIRCNRWNDAALADAGSMVCYGVLKALLARAFPGEDQQALHNTLLKALPNLVSSIPPLELWKLSRTIRGDGELASLFAEAPADVVLSTLAGNPRFAPFQRDLDAFLDQWGFRCSAELMLTVPSFQENPAPLIDLLRAYVGIDGESPVDLLDRQQRERLEATSRVLSQLRQRPVSRFVPFLRQSLIVSTVLRWTQRSIQLRERARLKQALLYSRLRRIVLAMGEGLRRQGRIDRVDDLFLLTIPELDALVAGVEMFPDHVRDLVALRRRAHADVSAVAPPDSMKLAAGEYFRATPAIEPDTPPSDRTAAMTGVGACGGATTGRATILTDVAESHLLSPGDVLVTRQTDPGWGPVFPLISGLVMERGGMLSHGAIIAREFGIPSVVGVRDATRRIPQGGLVTIDGDRGVVHLVEGAA